MGEVAFYVNAPDRLEFSCRWLRRALRESGVRKPVLVIADEAEAKSLDHLLWTFDPLSFVPHVRAIDPSRIDGPMKATPVQILASLEGADPATSCVLNLARQVPDGIEPFEQVFEVVGREEDDKGPARERWKAYKSLGFALKQQELPA